MARRHRMVTRGNRQVRESLWVGFGEVIQALGAASTAVITNAPNAALLALRPYTIVRTRGFVGLRSDQISASENYDMALGMCVVSDQANAIGVTAVPTPFTDIGSDLFFVHEILMGRFQFITGAGFDSLGLVWKQYDSKAMRKVNDDSQNIVVVESSTLGQGQVVHHAGRQLIKLH